MSKAESNRANGQHSTGPKTAEGKAKVSANALKLGFFVNVDCLNLAKPTCKSPVENSFTGEHPTAPSEEHLIRELAHSEMRCSRQ